MACVRGGFGGAELDMAAALAVSTAQGVPAGVVADWLAAFTNGLHAGTAARRQRDAGGDQQERPELR